jgi:hypothetical protein
LLQLYVALEFGHPLANLAAMRKQYAGSPLDGPLIALLRGLFAQGQLFEGHFLLRKAGIWIGAAFYVWVLVDGFRRRSARTAPLLAWLAIVLGFCLSIGWPFGYYYFSRFVLLGWPPAALLLAERAPRDRRAAVAALAGLAALSVAVGVVDVVAVRDLCLAVWTPGYFQRLVPLLR